MARNPVWEIAVDLGLFRLLYHVGQASSVERGGWYVWEGKNVEVVMFFSEGCGGDFEFGLVFARYHLLLLLCHPL